MSRPKILHIGGAHSVHVADLVRALSARGYDQCVLSYRKEGILPKSIPVYIYPYDRFFPDKQLPGEHKQLRLLISDILKKEKPTIAHGHFLVYSCVPINLVKRLSPEIPTYLTPWSAKALTTNRVLYLKLNECLSRCKYFLTASSWVFSLFQKYYPNLRTTSHINWRLPLDLSAYHHLQPSDKNIEIPRILSARVMQESNHQDLLVRALPIIFERYKDALVTLIIGQHAVQGKRYFGKMIELAKNLGVYPRCRFIASSLSQLEFSDLIKKHNIVYSISDSDVEGSQTTYQAAYSGAITLIKESPYGYDVLKPNDNLLTVPLTAQDVLTTLLYATDNLEELCGKFFVNNRKLKLVSSEYMIPILTNLYNKELPCK